MSDILTDFSARLRRARDLSGLSQHELAKRCGFTKAALNSYEAQSRRPPLNVADQLARGLGYVGLGAFLTACHECLGFSSPGRSCAACTLPEGEIPERELIAFQRLRRTIRAGASR